jgi:hypothetical protein
VLALRVGLRPRAGYRIDDMEKAKPGERLACVETPGQDHPKPEDFRFSGDRHTGVFTCRHVWSEGNPILFVSHDEDGDWQFLCGDDHGADARNDGLLVCLEHIVSRDPSINELATMCTAHVATRKDLGAPWKIEDGTPDHVRDTINKYGWWVGLIDSDGEAPAFAYTIGLYENLGHPEIIVFGLPLESMHGVLNQCGDMIRGGTRFCVGESVSGVLDGYDVRFRAVSSKASYAAYFGYGCHHYGDQLFPVLQLLWPDKQHRFPGDDGAADFLVKQQPLLA